MATTNPRLSVTFTPEVYEQLRLLSAKTNISMAQYVSNWAIEGLNGTLNTENIDLITKIIRNQLKDVLTPEVERLANLSAKTCVQAGTAAYLSAEAILKFVPDNKQIEVEVAYEKARKKSLAYIRGNANLSE